MNNMALVKQLYDLYNDDCTDDLTKAFIELTTMLYFDSITNVVILVSYISDVRNIINNLSRFIDQHSSLHNIIIKAPRQSNTFVLLCDEQAGVYLELHFASTHEHIRGRRYDGNIDLRRNCIYDDIKIEAIVNSSNIHVVPVLFDHIKNRLQL